tara:strand:- start:281 stop:1351 length:1071 start_codon:yes stop_codon:yes gene_type:complete
MINEPRDITLAKLKAALRLIGSNKFALKKLIACLIDIENGGYFSGSTREQITDPLLEAAISSDAVFTKKLNDGLKVEYLYRTKIARDLLLSGENGSDFFWEPQTTKLLKLFGAKIKGEVIVGGAYFGDQSLILAKKIGKRGCVHCFEPDICQRSQLEKNVESNGISNIFVNKEALWEKSGISSKLEGFDAYARVIPDNKGIIKTISIDEYVTKKNLLIKLIQLDIEGSEFNALKGAISTIKRDQPIIIFEIHYEYMNWDDGIDNTKIYKLLSELGYKLYGIRDTHFHANMKKNPVELIKFSSIYLEGPPHGFNVLALPQAFPLPKGLKLVNGVSPKLLPHKDPKYHHPCDGFSFVK